MAVRKLTLEEWFLYYQLRHIKNRHFHLPGFIEVDLSRVATYYKEKGRKLPLSLILVKAAGLLVRECPEINRQIFKTPFGLRFLESESTSVNVPIQLNVEGHRYISAMVIKDVGVKSVGQIGEEIKKFKSRTKKDLVVGKYIIGKKNTFLNRMRLRLIHFMINSFPHLQEKFGVGGIAVSSLLNLDSQGIDVRFVAKGHNAFTICACTYEEESMHLKLGIGWDHYTGHGVTGVEVSMVLGSILQAENSENFRALTDF